MMHHVSLTSGGELVAPGAEDPKVNSAILPPSRSFPQQRQGRTRKAEAITSSACVAQRNSSSKLGAAVWEIVGALGFQGHPGSDFSERISAGGGQVRGWLTAA